MVTNRQISAALKHQDLFLDYTTRPLYVRGVFVLYYPNYKAQAGGVLLSGASLTVAVGEEGSRTS